MDVVLEAEGKVRHEARARGDAIAVKVFRVWLQRRQLAAPPHQLLANGLDLHELLAGRTRQSFGLLALPSNVHTHMYV